MKQKRLLKPLINLRKCQDLNEALMCWSLNNEFLQSTSSLNYSYLISNSLLEDTINFRNKIRWFLSNEFICLLVPQRFKIKVEKIHKLKTVKTHNITNFMDVIFNIHKHFCKLTRNYFKKEHIESISNFDLIFQFDLFGNFKDSKYPKSLFLNPPNNDYIRLKSFAIIFKLRWFFNTRYNSRKPLGLDGEYGRTITGFAQTFHKYDDVLRWLITHPNTVDEVEFVVLDVVPPNFIF